MFYCLVGNRFFIKIVPVNAIPGEKRVSIYSAVSEKSTRKHCELFLALFATRFVVLKSFGFLGFIYRFNLIGVRNSLAGIARMSPLT